jgi:hypothetical protein
MATDRALSKQMQAGALSSVASANNATSEIARQHSRAYPWVKYGAENSSNNVVETTMFTVARAGVVKSVKLVANTSVAANATNGFVITVAKRTAGGSAVTVATWNTDTNAAAQGAITAFAPASLSVVTSSDSTLAAADVLTFKCIKFGAGLLLDGGAAVVVDVEEV